MEKSIDHLNERSLPSWKLDNWPRKIRSDYLCRSGNSDNSKTIGKNDSIDFHKECDETNIHIHGDIRYYIKSKYPKVVIGNADKKSCKWVTH